MRIRDRVQRTAQVELELYRAESGRTRTAPRNVQHVMVAAKQRVPRSRRSSCAGSRTMFRLGSIDIARSQCLPHASEQFGCAVLRVGHGESVGLCAFGASRWLRKPVLLIRTRLRKSVRVQTAMPAARARRINLSPAQAPSAADHRRASGAWIDRRGSNSQQRRTATLSIAVLAAAFAERSG